jgi:hypothetical protein
MTDEKVKEAEGCWQAQEAREVQPKISRNLQALLEQLRGSVEKQLNADQQTLAQVQEMLHRLKYGGGQ